MKEELHRVGGPGALAGRSPGSTASGCSDPDARSIPRRQPAAARRSRMAGLARRERTRQIGWACGVALVSLLTAARVQAHALGQSYIFLQVLPAGIGGRVEMTLSDLDDALSVDADGDGKVSSGEFEARADEATRYVSERIRFRRNESELRVRFTRHDFLSVPLGRFVQFHFILEGIEEIPPQLDVEASLLFDTNPRHLVLLVIEYNQLNGLVNNRETVSLVFDADRRRRTLDLVALPGESEFGAFVLRGALSFWRAPERVLLLLLLLLGAVLARAGCRAASTRRAALHALRIFAVFAVAHSLTLGLAALGIVELPSRWSESLVAASVLLAAVNIVRPIFGAAMSWPAFGLGLCLGLGWATTFEGLLTPESSLGETLLGFNLGAEIGQLAMIAVALPLVLACRDVQVCRRFVIPSASTLIALTALVWLIERALDMEMIPLR